MSDLDVMTQTVAENPDDLTGRHALADRLREHGDYETADAIQGSSGPALLQSLILLATRVGLPITAKLLWAAYVLLPRLNAAGAAPQIPVSPGFMPDTPELSPLRPQPRQPWFVPDRRDFWYGGAHDDWTWTSTTTTHGPPEDTPAGY